MVPDTARCVDPANLHMTLVFLGSVDTSTQRCCESAADTVRADRFSIIFNRLGCWARRGIAWAGASPHPAALSVLVEQLNAALDRCGFKPETRPFRAHVTLARNARHCNSGVSIEPFRWDVDRFCLVVSDPNTAGRRYQILRAWNLS
jgi:2'-5' RNA ligase